MDSKGVIEALPRASTDRTLQEHPKPRKIKQNTKTLLVHPFRKSSDGCDVGDATEKTTKPYLLETPKELIRKRPLLQIPSEFSKRPKLYINCDNETTADETNQQDVSEKSATVEALQTTNETEMRNTDQQVKPRREDSNNQELHACQIKIQNPCPRRCCCQIENSCRCVNTQGCQESDLTPKCGGKTEVVSKCCGCQSQPVKVIFAPAMVPGMRGLFGPMPGIQYVVKQPANIGEQVSEPCLSLEPSKEWSRVKVESLPTN